MNLPNVIHANESAKPLTSVPTASGTVTAASAARRPSLSATGPMPNPPRNPPATRTEGRGSIRSDVGVEFIGVRSGVERRRGVSGLKARGSGRRETPAKVLKE
eukprot:31445-Pelagococcus_subviridis.AAC.8